MEWWLLTFFFSAILSLFIPIVPEFSLLLIILLVSLIFIFIGKFRFIAIAVFAVVWILIAGSQYQGTLEKNNIKLEQLHKKVHLIQGEVNNIVHTKAGSSRFNFLVSHWQGRKINEKFKVRLTWKAADKPLLQGQKWQLTVKLKPAHGLANIGGFNYQVWLRQQKIVATGYVKTKNKIQTKKQNVLLLHKTSWRQYLYQKLSVLLADKPLSALVLALGFGERGELTREHWRVLSATATQHLIAISGLHIGIVAFASLIFMRIVIRLLPLSSLLPTSWQLKLMQINLNYAPILCSGVMAWYYAYLAGFSIPTLRALVMLLLFWSLKIMHIKVTLLPWLLLAVLIILLVWPLSLLSASFWLSISALVIIFSTFSRFSMRTIVPVLTRDKTSLLTLESSPKARLKKQWHGVKTPVLLWLKTLFVMQLALTIAMLPIAASLNYQLPLAAFFANIVAVPLMSVTVIPLTLLAVIALPFSLWLANFFTDLALLSLSYVWQWLLYLASAEWAVLAISYQQIQTMLLLFVMIALAVFFRLARAKFIAALSLFIMAVVINFSSAEQQQEWRLSVLDVGHGLAVVIEKNHHVFLYDTGASYPSGFNMADAAILPYLKHQGYQAIDGVIISHNDNDHAGGLRHLRAKMAIKRVIANDLVLKPDSHCISGQRFTWQGLVFEVLSPMQVDGDKNDDSCVVTISDGFHRVLLPGDISIKQEKRLLNVAGMAKKLSSDILIAPHHGSKSSSSRGFLTAVMPRYVVFSTGYLNRWQMPSNEIMGRYNSFDIMTFNTVDEGMVTFKFSQTTGGKNIEPSAKDNIAGTVIEVISYRDDIRPYWFVN
ncbi:DNA internalization-related competence protein ComEC/Rec2 [Colwellia sp. MB02u-6]|uniref:DNA internalization-related competence protein ComEC/Rec2 n=1 Tax=Colwellia sp. MB02u-6 TaxID=2759824 RepID=UPI0015F5D0FB|nr:DNA internalization-related competence protein ComEC/Rec2 [Colwellia sp. MB02u-6]MBA6328005.1 DNA internalization-related competence protein ComEC/Rec2 [Colwellia sp. MB02u-6]